MVGPASQDWQPRPSQLRNEMRHTPSDDPRSFEGEEIQVPDSQTEVPDTQIPSDSLSPNSAALVRQYTVSKTAGPSFSLMPVRMFTEEPSLGESSHRAEAHVGFAFGQPGQGPNKPFPKLKPPVAREEHNLTKADSMKAIDEKQPSPPSRNPFTTAVPSSSLQTPDTSTYATKETEAPPSSVDHHTDNTVKGGDEFRDMNEDSNDAPTSAQLTSSHPEARKKFLVAKRVKRVKKGPQGRQPDGPWPPRTHGDSGPIKDTGLLLKVSSQKLGRIRKARRPDALPTIPEHHESGAITQEVSDHEIRSSKGDGDQDHVSPLGAPAVLRASPPCSPSDVSNNLADGLGLSASNSPNVPSAVESNANDTQAQVVELHNKPVGTGSPQPKLHANAVQEVGQHNTELMAPANQTAHSAEPQARLRNRPDQEEATLHGVSYRAASHRVEKSQKQRRPSKATQQSSTSSLLRLQGGSKQLSFEQTWDMLRTAHRSDLTRKDHDVARQAEHFEEVKALLRGQIDHYSMSLADEKCQHESLKASMSHLREKAKTNQKYATGLQKDYEKLKKVAIGCQEDCKKTLQQKALELEHEKESLRREVSLVLDNVAKGQKKLKSTADELYLRLQFSEGRRMLLVDELAKQAALYAEEKATRNSLEGRLLSLGPCMQEQLRDHSSQLIEKLEKLQASVNGVSSQQQQNPAGVDACLNALRQLQSTPFLTLEHAKKSETMLRTVYEGLGARLDSVAKSVKIKSLPTVDLQVFIKEQLEELQSKLLKFDELDAQNRKTQDTNTSLRQQLETEQQDIQRLRKEIDDLRQHEQRLQSTKAELETQVAGLEDTARDQCEELTIIRQNAEELGRELNQLREKCEAAKAESERLRLELQRRDQEVNECKLAVEKLKEENKQLAEKAKQKYSNDTDLRQKIEDDLKHEFDHEIRKFRNDVDRLTNERNERDVLIQKHNEKLNAVKASSEETAKDVQKLHFELEVARKDRIEMDARLKKAQRAAQNESASAAEVAGMKELLKQKEKALGDGGKQLEELQHAYDNVETQNSSLRTMCEQQHMEINQHPTKLETLRREIEHDFNARQQKDEAATKEAQNDADNLRKERDNVHAKLEQAQLHASQLTKAYAAIITERDVFKQQSTELEKTRKINESHLLRHEEEGATRAREHKQKLQELQRQLEQCTESTRVAEAKIKLQQAEHTKKMGFDREKYELLVQKLTQDLEEAKKHASIERDAAQRSSQSVIRADATAHDAPNSNSKKSRKKVDRGNHSVLTFTGLSGTAASPTMMPMSRTRSRSPSGHSLNFDCNDNLFEEDPDRNLEEDDLWNQDLSLVDPDAEPVEDTQEIPSFGLALVLKDMDASMGNGSPEGTRRGGKLPADQSSLSSPPSSDELAMMSEDNRKFQTSEPRMRSAVPSLHSQQDERVEETPIRRKNVDNLSSQLSQLQTRPLSQANTSSRMMPPPTTSDTFSRYTINKEGSRQSALREQDLSSRHNSRSSLDNVQHSPSNVRSSDTRQLQSSRPGHHTSRSSGRDQKRKTDSGQEGSSKRQRQSSKSQLFGSSGTSSHYSHSSQSEQNRESMAGNMTFLSRPSSTLDSPVAGSRSTNKAAVYGSQYGSSSGSKSRDSQPSASRLTTPARSHRVYGRHQTRSKTQESERFERELLGR